MLAQTADAELGRRLALFEAFESVLCDHVTAHGFWCDAVDPRSGTALRGAPGGKYSEAIGAQVFRGYGVATQRLVCAVQHPRHGVHTYPCHHIHHRAAGARAGRAGAGVRH